MPNVKSAEKRMRTSAVRAERNKARRTRLRNAIRKVRQADSAEAAGTALKDAISLLDRAAAKRLIHPNKAARDKSRLTALLGKLGA
ncbi:MAG TPA: 30S ribosomal protein S20 [Longimicrobiaceae bacterium]